MHEKNGTSGMVPLPSDGLAVFGVFVTVYDDSKAFSIVDEALKNVVESGNFNEFMLFELKK